MAGVRVCELLHVGAGSTADHLLGLIPFTGDSCLLFALLVGLN